MAEILTRRLVLPAVAAGLALLLAAGIVLWLRNGASVFFDIVSAGLAACF